MGCDMTYFFVVIDQGTPIPAKCSRPNNRILFIFIFQAGSYQVHVKMLPAYIHHKDGTFLYKIGLFHTLMPHSLRVPIQIVKYFKNGHIIFGGAIDIARAAW